MTMTSRHDVNEHTHDERYASGYADDARHHAAFATPARQTAHTSSTPPHSAIMLRAIQQRSSAPLPQHVITREDDAIEPAATADAFAEYA